ncbi:MAG TPA: hypothetical protein VG944_05950 [Fimbriimonas sp.]|nr:hypothetical protein [Fimbriimonas sp.]
MGAKIFKRILFCAGLGAVAVSAQAQAVNTQGHALITIVPTLSITMLANTNWGTVTLPTSGTTNYTLSTSNGQVTITSGSGFSFGDSNAGSYLITGGALEPVSYSVSIGSFSGTGVSVVDAYVDGTSSSASGTLSALGTLTVSTGGVLSVGSDASTVLQTATVTLTVNYN